MNHADLLKACKDVVDRLEDHLSCYCEHGFVCEPCAVMQSVRDAIAKEESKT